MTRNAVAVVRRVLLFVSLAGVPLAWGDVSRAWQGVAPSVSLEPTGDGFVRLAVDDASLGPDEGAVGAPALPRKTVLFAVPDRSSVSDLSFDVDWEPVAENVRIVPVAEPVRVGDDPVAPVPDAAVYGGTDVYPPSPVVDRSDGTMCGVRVFAVTVAPFRWSPVSGRLERAARLSLRVSFAEGTDRSYVLAPLMLDSVRSAVVNAEDVSVEPSVTASSGARPMRKLALAVPKLATAETPAAEKVDYLLISPPDFYDDWRWYVGERKKVHANLTFKVKNTAEIYAEYPFPTDDIRNAAESIHAYLRANRQAMGFTYIVLGGAWLDVQNRLGYPTYFASGELMSLSNCVPGIYGYPREDWRCIPSDLFYGCLDMVNGQKYPWDWDGNGYYINQNECGKNDLYPDAIVSRITLNPFTGVANRSYDQHALVTNYVAKLRRGEAKDFVGHYRYGMSAASTGSSKLRKTGDRMYYRELEFYDGMLNMFDPRHHDTLEDDEYSVRVRYYDQYSNWRPVRSVKGMMNYTWTGGLPTLSAAMDDYYASDRDFGFVQAHGWAQGAAQFSAGRFATAKGLTLFNGGSGPCETGYPDYYVMKSGKHVLEYNVGDAAVTNPDGGALASVNNSRWSWAGGGGGYAAMSYYMLNEMLIGFNKERMDVGHAWLKGVRNYHPAGKNGGTAGWVLTEQFLYGDPLVRLPEVPNVWWTGGETGIWDRVTANWTNSVDDAKTFDAAYNVYFNVQSNLDLDVAGEIAAMRLSIPVWLENAVVSFAGAGTLRVMQSVDVAGTNTTLRFNVEGGVGHSGIQFLTGAGDLVFTGTKKFYVGGVKNARSVSLLGGGVTLDVDEFPTGSFPIAIDGSQEPSLPLPNVLRSKNVGGLRRFGSLAITNSHVKLSTVDAFGNGAPMTHALVDSTLEIAANVYYQRSGYPEGLNATFLVDGDSAVTGSEGGVWTVKHTTTFALGAGRSGSAHGTHLKLGAETVNAGGRIVITNALPTANYQQPTTNYPLPTTNSVEVLHASALSGDVTIGAGIRLVLHELPLSSVTSLTVGEGATVVLPDDASGYWQIVPVSSKFTCAPGVTFATASNPHERVAGSTSQTGAFFRDGALYKWTGAEGDWNTFFANRHPKILFGDLTDLSSVTVRVAAAVSPEFVFFSNLDTKYVFVSADEAASVFFSSVFLYGPTDFDVPVSATEYVEVSTATTRFSRVTAPHVAVAAGAGLALAGSHWTEFRLAAGAVLVAVPGDTLDWNGDTSLVFPENGEVLIDIGGIALSDTPTPLITGFGHVWTAADLKRFRLLRPDAELRLVDGALCVVRGDAIDGPYSLAFEGMTNWNCSAWTATTNGTAFPRKWGDCSLDWSADAVVDVRTMDEGQKTEARLTLDCDVHVDTLTIHAGTNDFSLTPVQLDQLPSTRYQLPSLSVVTLDLTDCHGETDIGVDTGAAAILTASSTNGTDVIRLHGAGSGAIELAGVTLVLDQPGDFTLMKGAQGTLRVVAPQAYERFRVAKVPSGFENSGLTVEVIGPGGTVVDGFSTVVSDGALWAVPPALQAEVPPGTNDLTRLAWRDVLGNVVSNVDWTSSAGFRLIGTETSGVVIAKSGFASVWSRLSVSNEVTLYGNEVLSPSQIPSGNGVLALAGGFTIKADVNANQHLLNGTKLKLVEGTTLEIRHRSTNYNATSQDWSGITGTGRILFADAANTWIALPTRIFANTLSVETHSDIVVTAGFGTANPLGVRNLSGSGLFRADWDNGNNTRPVRTVQTGVTAFSGRMHVNDNRKATLVVSSDDAVASTNKALVLTGTAELDRTLTIETNGCVILTGTWKGEIKVFGLLVITNACATNGLKVTVSGQGAVKTVAPDEVPAVTSAPTYVPPTYPEDPVVPVVPAVDTRVRILAAAVGGETALPTWTRLDWRDTNGVKVTEIDWADVTNVTITATNGATRVLFDAEAFTGVVRLGRAVAPSTAAVTIEARKTRPFTLASDSVGTIDFRLNPVPTASTDLIYLAPSTNYQLPSTNYQLPSANYQLSVTVHDRYGREIDVAGEVAFDANGSKYYLNVQNVSRPTYSNTFDTQYDDTLTSSLWFSGSGNLTYKARSDLFEESRSGRALKGQSMNGYAMHSHNGNPTVGMDNVSAWSLNFVAKLPTNNGGIIFGWGNKDSGNGVALARRSENVAGVYAWENGGGARLVASANVPFASTQFHCYAITHDSETLCLYVDGVLAQAVPLKGKYPTRGFYQWFKMYGQNGSLGNGPTSVVDDFRLYLNCCLTPASVRAIANDFPPWPERPTAEVDVGDLAWSNLCWSAAYGADESLTLKAGEGSLLVDAPVAVTNPLVVAGGTVPVKLAGNGVLSATRGLSVSSSLQLDASGLDGTNLAAAAVADVPYARWLLRGAYSGTVEVTALPEVPDGYEVRVEQFSNLGVRLVFTAPRYAFADAVGISVGPDAFGDITGTVGLHPTSPANWYPYAVWTNEAVTVGGLSVTGSDGGAVDSQQPYGNDASVARYFRHTSFDGNNDTYNGKTNGLVIAGLSDRFDRYRVLVYLATDTEGANFGPVTIAGRTYCGLAAGSETEWATVADSTALAWGKSRVAAATEGVNVVVSDVLDANEVSVSAQRLKHGNTYARAQIAAVEIVKVGVVYEFTGSRYSADVVKDAEWNDGKGDGLDNHPVWKNGAFSSICLTATVANATLTFDTAVTAETFRVVTSAGQTLTLRRDGADMAVYAYDFSESEGTVRLAGGLNLGGADGAPCVLAAGPKGTLDFFVSDVSTDQRLMKLAAGFDCAATDCTYLAHDAQGNPLGESWMVLPVDGWLVLQRRDVDRPWYSLTFENSLSTFMPGSTNVTLVSEGHPTYVAARGGGRAMTGGTPYTGAEMASVPASWTIHAVAQMPKESNGTLFGYGRLGQRGVGILTVDANNVAVAWWDSRGKATVINAAVTNATCQFHAYALVSTGTSVSLYVDGEFRGRAVAEVNPGSPVVQFGSIQGGVVSGFVKTTTGAMDDWRLYNGVLSPTAIRTLANAFAPWPEYRTAALTAEGTDWDDLTWTGAAADATPLLVDSAGGALAVTNACELTNAVYATGRALMLRMAGDGVLRANAGLTLLAGWTIDCSGLDATNLMHGADAASPYEHWLVRGAYSGDDPTVVGLPDLTAGYSIAVVADPQTGVRLVVTVRADYVANLTNATAWAGGAGSGLEVLSVPWVNGGTSTITLTQRMDVATLDFDTAVTARLFKVVSEEGQTLALRNGNLPVVLAEYDFSRAQGAVAFSNDVPTGTTVDLGRMTVFGGAMNGSFGTVASGATVRYGQPGLTLAGGTLRADVTNCFSSAVVNGNVYNNARTYLVQNGDSLTIRPSGGDYDNYRFSGRIVVEGGRLLLDSANAKDKFWYGVCGASSFTQTGGETVANAKSDVTNGNGCFLLGNTGGGNIPFNVMGGTFAVADSPVCFWQDANITLTVGGTGVVRVKGLWGNGTKGIVNVNAGGVLSVGTKGIAASLKELNLNGGTLTAHADATTAKDISLGGNSVIAAEAGVTHTVSGAITGSGKITVGAPGRTGTVVLGNAGVFAREIELAYGVLDIGAYRPATALKRTGGMIQVRLTDEEVARKAPVTLLPLASGETNTDYIVCSPAGAALETGWTVVSNGWLTIDTAQLDFSKFVPPFRGAMEAGKAWADQTWYDSAVPSNRIPSIYWPSAANVVAEINIEAEAVVADIPASVTDLTVTGEGTVVSDGKWPTFKGLADAAWRGTVRIRNKTNCVGEDFTNLGNANSTVELDGVSGWFGGTANYNTGTLTGKSHPYALKIGEHGFSVVNGGSNLGFTFAKLTGSGYLAFGGATPTIRMVVLDASAFTGRIAVLANAGLTIGTPTKNPANGQLVVAKDATASVDPSNPWSAVTGTEFASGSTLNVRADGTAESYTVVSGGTFTFPDGAALTFNGGENVRTNWYADGGTLRRVETWAGDVSIDAAYARQIVRVTQPTTLVLTNVGRVSVGSRIDATAAKLTIDACGLDVAKFVRYAVAGAPYSHWIVQGPVSGDIVVSKLPEVPPTYSVTWEKVDDCGVRLVVTADRAARFGAISVNLCQDASLAATDATSGLHPVRRRDWANLTVAANASLTVSNATFALGSNVTSWKIDNAPSDDIYRQYMDDGSGRTSVLTVSGIGYEQYRVIVYYSTDTANSNFQPLVLNGVRYSARPAGATTVCPTLKGVDAVWGNTGPNHQALAPAEGVNALVSDVLTGDTVTLQAIRPNNSNARATVAAIQVVKVGDIYEGLPEVRLATKLSRVLPGTVTTQTYDYVYHPQGADDHTWATAANWATAEVWQRGNGVIETEYTAYTGATAPALSGSGKFVPVLVDGRTVNAAAIEGWEAQYGFFNGAKVTVETQTKFQGNSPMRVAVDETSQFVIKGWGTGTFDNTVNFYIAAPSGLVAKTAYDKKAAFDYWLTGAGSVCFEAGFSGTHRLKSATVELGDARWTEKEIRRKYLVIGNGTVTTDGATVRDGGVRKADNAVVSAADEVGTHRLGKDETGTFIEWVARKMPEVFEAHPSETDVELPVDETNRVKIVCLVSNGQAEVKVDLTAAFRLEKTVGGVRATLNPAARVLVPAIGAAAEEVIAVTPELATVVDDAHVADVPFAVTEDSAAVGVKTIPGLLYRLMRGSEPTAFDHEAAAVRATSTRLKLEDKDRPTDKAFYLIRVER